MHMCAHCSTKCIATSDVLLGRVTKPTSVFDRFSSFPKSNQSAEVRVPCCHAVAPGGDHPVCRYDALMEASAQRCNEKADGLPSTRSKDGEPGQQLFIRRFLWAVTGFTGYSGSFSLQSKAPCSKGLRDCVLSVIDKAVLVQGPSTGEPANARHNRRFKFICGFSEPVEPVFSMAQEKVSRHCADHVVLRDFSIDWVPDSWPSVPASKAKTRSLKNLRRMICSKPLIAFHSPAWLWRTAERQRSRTFFRFCRFLAGGMSICVLEHPPADRDLMRGVSSAGGSVTKRSTDTGQHDAFE